MRQLKIVFYVEEAVDGKWNPATDRMVIDRKQMLLDVLDNAEVDARSAKDDAANKSSRAARIAYMQEHKDDMAGAPPDIAGAPPVVRGEGPMWIPAADLVRNHLQEQTDILRTEADAGTTKMTDDIRKKLKDISDSRKCVDSVTGCVGYIVSRFLRLKLREWAVE